VGADGMRLMISPSITLWLLQTVGPCAPIAFITIADDELDFPGAWWQPAICARLKTRHRPAAQAGP
jgi:hypothetical protein